MNVNLQAPINYLGYGVVGRNLASAFIHGGVNTHIQCIGPPDTSLLTPDIAEALRQNVVNHSPSWPLIKVWHQHQLIERIGNGKYYGFPIFELDRFTPEEIYHLKVPDELMVASQWARDVIKNTPELKDKTVHVVPFGVDRNVFHDDVWVNVDEDENYRFFTIGKLEYRKGHDFIVKCFNKAFEREDKVELNLLVHNVFLDRETSDQWYAHFKQTKLGDKINILPQMKTQQNVAEFISKNDCGLFPARAEGWNLELLESMSCGKPVITTNYSAHTEYCKPENSLLIDIDDTEDAHDHMGGRWFRGQGKWAELEYKQEEQMIEHMRYCFNGKRDVNPNGVKTAKQFSWDNSVKKILEIL